MTSPANFVQTLLLHTYRLDRVAGGNEGFGLPVTVAVHDDLLLNAFCVSRASVGAEARVIVVAIEAACRDS